MSRSKSYKPRRLSNAEVLAKKIVGDKLLKALVEFWPRLDRSTRLEIVNLAGDAVVRKMQCPARRTSE